MAREDPQLKLRLTEELRDRLKAAAEENARSMNAEIVQRLEFSFLSVPSLPKALYQRVEYAARSNHRSVEAEIEIALRKSFPEPVMTIEKFLDFLGQVGGSTEFAGSDKWETQQAVDSLRAKISAGEISPLDKVSFGIRTDKNPDSNDVEVSFHILHQPEADE